MIDLIALDSQRCLNNRYTLGSELGTGGLSIVYEAIDGYSDYYGDIRPLAVKLPLEHLAEKSDIDAFMYAEYAHLTRLSHPNIIKVIDFGIDAYYNIPYLVLERMDGKLLKDVSLPTLSRSYKKNICNTLFDVMQYLHAQHIIHADISPANIMLLDTGEIRLFDFGISINTALNHPFELDYSAAKAYNPLYAAPEILEGKTPSRESDLFSLAVIIYELYEHSLPYVTNSLELQEKPITLFHMKKVPFKLKYWLLKSLNYTDFKRKYKL
jgi:serine/threonine protein kinase